MNKIFRLELQSGTFWFMLAKDHAQARLIAKEMGLITKYKDIKRVTDSTSAWSMKFPTGTKTAQYYQQQGQLFFRVTTGEKMTQELRKTGVVFEGSKDDVMERRLVWVLIPWSKKEREKSEGIEGA